MKALVSFRRPGPLFRLVAHLLARLLVITSLPAPMQAYAVLFPVSMLWPLIEAGEAPGVSSGAKTPTSVAEDPLGNITNIERSQYFDPATGMTAVGAGGGVIAGDGGVELRIPEGALERSVPLKLSLATQDDFPQLPELGPDTYFGAAIKIESSERPVFAKPLQLVFPKPADAPLGDSTYYNILKKVAGPNGITVYEAIGIGDLEQVPYPPGTPDPPPPPTYRVVTQNLPVFRGWRDSEDELPGVSHAPQKAAKVGTSLLYDAWYGIVMRTFYELLPGRPLPGMITGKVLRVKWGSPGDSPQYEPIEGAYVTGTDSGGFAVLGTGGSFARSGADGSFALWDSHFVGGSFTVEATVNGVVRSATAFQMNAVDTHNAGLGRYNAARASIIFPAQEPPPPPPQVAVRLFKLVDGVRQEITGGLVVEGTPLLITLKPSLKDLEIRNDGIEINGSRTGLTVAVDSSIPWNPQEEAPTYLVQDGSSQDGLFVPGNVGAYALKIKVMRLNPPSPEPFYVNYTFRAVTAGGGVDNDPNNPPGIIDARTLPKDNARGVPVGVTPQLSFTEPVKNVKSNVFLDEVGGDTIPLKLIGIGPQGQVIPVVTDADVVTAITVQPCQPFAGGCAPVGLKFLTKYRLRVRPGNDPPEPTDLLDLDVTALGDPKPKTLAQEYAVGFETFGPEDIQAQSDSKAIAGLAALGDLVYVAETHYRGGISPFNADGWFWRYDLSDPTEPKETSLAYLHAPPSDLAIEPTRRLVAISMGSRTAPVAHPDGYIEILSSPSNVYLYDVKEGEPEKWVGAVSMTNGLLDGMVQRLSLKGDKVYTATWRKGIQIVDVDTVTGMFKSLSADPAGHVTMLREMGLYGHGWGLENVATIPVKSPPPPAAPLRDINLFDVQAADVSYRGVVQTLVFATGASADGGLVIADPASNEVVKQMAAGAITNGYAVEVTTLASKPIALVGGVGTGGGLLVVFDLSPLSQNPALNPVVLSSLVIGGWPTDVVMSGNTAIVAIGGGKAALVDVTNPLAPNKVGLMEGVGTRLALTDSNLLVSTYRTYLAGVNNPLQGLHVAALGNLALVEFDPARIVVGESGYETAESFKLKYRVIPPTFEVRASKIQWRIFDATQSEQNAPMTDGRGELNFPLGHSIPRIGAVLARPRLVINAGEADEIVGPVKAWKTEKAEVRFVWADRDVDQETAPDAELKGHVVTADYPELEMEVVSDEWIRRQMEAGQGQVSPLRQVDWRALTAPGWSRASLADDGVFDALLNTGTSAGTPWQLEARINDVVLGQTDSFALEPGVARSITVTPTSPSLRADEASAVTLTATARDAFGNLVGDDTPVSWEIVHPGDGKLLYTSPGSTAGQAIAIYMAGTDTGPLTLRAYADEAVGEITIEREQVGLTLSAPSNAYWLAPVEVTLTAPGVSDLAEVFWFATVGQIVPTQGLQDGTAKARWEMGPRAYRKKVQLIAFVGASRAGHEVLLDRDPGPVAPMAPAAPQAGMAASVEPMVVAGDLTADGPAEFEAPDGTTVVETVKATATYKVSGLVPGQHVTLRLGSWRRPNREPILYLSQQREGATLFDLAGRHHAQVSGGVTVGVPGYQGEGLHFDGTGLLTIGHDPEFEFGSGFELQVAVKPGTSVATEAVLFDKPGDYRLSLVPVGGETRVRWTIQTAAGPLELTSQAALDPQRWTVLSGRYDAGRMYLGLDGQDESLPVPAAPTHGGSALQVGAAYVGDMDEVRLFDLSKGSLSTFANGAQTLSFTVDASGAFETSVVSSGQFGQGQMLGSAANAQDPSLTERQLGVYFTELESWIDETGERTQHPIGYASAWYLVALVKLMRGVVVGSENNDDLLVIVGDVIGSVAGPLAIYSLVRDLVNAGERVVRMQGSGSDALVMSACVVGIVAALTRLRVLGKAGKLLKLVARGSESEGALARLAALEVKIAAGAPLLSKAEKIVQVYNASQAAAAAVSLVVTYIGNNETVIAFFNNVLTGSPEPEAVSEELARQLAELDPDDIRMYITALGREFPEEPGAAVQSAGGAMAVAAPNAAPRLLAVNVVILKGAYNKGMKPASAAGRRNLAKTLVEKIRDASKRSMTRTAAISRALSHVPDGGRNVVELLKQLGHKSLNKVKAGRATLKIMKDVYSGDVAAKRTFFTNLGLGDPVTVTFHGVEEVFRIPSWLTKTGKTRKRFTDLVLEIRGVLHRIEIKAFDRLPTPQEFRGMVDAMRRDLIKHMTDADFSLDRLRWVFNSKKLSTAEMDTIKKELRKAANGQEFKMRLRETDPQRIKYPQTQAGEAALNADIARARAAISDIVRFHDLEL